MAVIIPEIYRGPPRSGNGGYVSGVFAGLLERRPEEPVEVTLRSPVPLDQPMAVDADGDGVRVYNDGVLVAEVGGNPGPLDLDIPAPPDFDTALAAQPHSISLQPREGGPMAGGRGFHPICYCCGADHEDGLYVFASRIDDVQSAAAWRTKTAWGDADGNLPAPLLWTALDCPGQVAFAVEGIRTGLLGRITASILRPAVAGEDYVVTAWREAVEGKKHFAGTAIFDRQGDLIASARSIWIGRQN